MRKIAIHSLALLSIIGATAFAQGGGDPTPVPNTECGTDKTVFYSQFTVVPSANGTTAQDALLNALESISGVVCQICPGGLQCERDSEQEGFPIVSGAVTQEPDGSWTFAGGFVALPGSLVIVCKDC